MGKEAVSVDRPMVGLKIKVVGAGSGACNVMAHMLEAAMPGADLVSVSTDWKTLSESRAQIRLPLGTSGLSITRPHKAREAAMDDIDKIRSVVADASLVVVVACLGGGTGCGVPPVIAREAQDMGRLTIGIVTTPFDFEGPVRMQNALEAISELRQSVDTLLVFENEKMLDELGDDATQAEAHAAIDRLLTSAVRSIVVTNQGQRWAHASYEDLRAVLQTPGGSWWGTAVADGPDRTKAAVNGIVERSRRDGIDLTKVKGMLVTISGAEGSMGTSEPVVAQAALRAAAPRLEQLACTAHFDECLADRTSVTVWATGLPGQIDSADAGP